MYRMYDLLCSPTLIGEYATLGDLKKAAREYDEDCEGDWFPDFKKLKNDKWTRKEYKF